jgi:hypothetical protein
MAGWNPFAPMRRNKMAMSPIDRASMPEFNPAIQDDSDAYPFRRPQFQMPPFVPPEPPPVPAKRLYTGVSPDAGPKISGSPGTGVPGGLTPRQQAVQTVMGRRSPTPDMPDRPDLQSFMGPQEPGPSTAPPFDRQKYLEETQALRKDRPRRSAYEEAVSTPPKAEEYNPSKWRRLAAILGGAAGGYAEGPGAGIATARTIIDQPYNRVMNDYERRIAGLREQAGAEAEDLDAMIADRKAAHDLELSYGELGFKGREVGVKEREVGAKEAGEVTDWYQAQAEIRDKISQIDHRLNQDISETERGILQRDRDASLAKLQAAQAEAARATAAAAPIHARAHTTSAEAAMKAAGTTKPRNLTATDIATADKLALAELSRDQDVAKYGIIIPNTYGGGGFRVDEEKIQKYRGPNGETITEMIEKKKNEILQKMKSGEIPTAGDATGGTEIPDIPGGGTEDIGYEPRQ